MQLVPGTRLGAYEIVGLIGAGGMGEVYRARDSRLDRQVAIKSLPDAFRADPERAARFEREAKLLASLNHPHIAAIYGLEQANGEQFIVMELVEGETLADRVARGPIPLDEALPIARQIAEALEAAHEQGIVHRDLKPANIKLRPDGAVKVLDFGLAKALALDVASGSGGLTNSPTLTSPIAVTGVGVLLGTAAYMSPEQAKGKAADKRSDVWAFGAVLYEMLTGKRAYDGEDVSDTLAAVLRGDPDWAALPVRTPAAVVTAMRRCLEKDRKQRARDIGDVSLALAGAFEGAAPATGLPVDAAPRPTLPRLFAVAASLLLAGLTGALAWILKPLPPGPQPMRFIVPPVAPGIAAASPYRDLVFTPDGQHLVYVVGTSTRDLQLMVRPIDDLDAIALRGLGVPDSPFVSPDSRWIGFVEEQANTLKKVALTGGPAIAICSMPSLGLRGASWGSDDVIVFATADSATGLFRVPAAGGEPVVLTTPDAARGEGDHVFPSVLPGGKAILFTITAPSTGDLETAQVAALDLQTGQWKTLIRGGALAEYVAPVAGAGPAGFLLYAAAGALRAVRFDPAKLAVLSDPVAVIEDVLTKPSGAAEFSVSRTGALAYLPGRTGESPQRSLVWVTRQGLETPVKAPPRAYESLQISPDGTRIALGSADQQRDIWIWDIAREILTRLTLNPGFDGRPLWTPDGHQIIFASDTAGSLPNLFRQPSNNTGAMERLTTSASTQVPWAISRDGTQLLFGELAPQTRMDLLLQRLDGSPARPVLQTRFHETAGALSPDGRWLAYESDESGQYEIHVRPFPNVDGGHWQVSATGGLKPTWSPSGRELFYLAPTDAMMAVAVQATSTFAYGPTTKLFDAPYVRAGTGRLYDVSPDGQNFLMIKQAKNSDRADGPAHMVVVLNWLEELQRLVPTK